MRTAFYPISLSFEEFLGSVMKLVNVVRIASFIFGLQVVVGCRVGSSIVDYELEFLTNLDPDIHRKQGWRASLAPYFFFPRAFAELSKDIDAANLSSQNVEITSFQIDCRLQQAMFPKLSFVVRLTDSSLDFSNT